MDCIVFGSGPSILWWVDDSKFYHPSSIKIAVNNASKLIEADYLSMLDCDGWLCVQNPDGTSAVKGRPKVIQNEYERTRSLQNHSIAKDYEWFDVKKVKFIDPISWTTFSFTAAVVVAWGLGCKNVYCYGADWTGSKDWDGTHYEMRHDSRWNHEKSIYTAIKVHMDTFLKDRGSRIYRVGYEMQRPTAYIGDNANG